MMDGLGLVAIGLSWVGALWSAWAWYEGGAPVWRRLGWGAWILHSAGVVGAMALLFYLLLASDFSYHYAWAHGSRLLSWAYRLAAVWEGQEGSFLLWMLWHVVLGWGLLLSKNTYRYDLAGGVALVNGFLSTFLLGATADRWLLGLVGAFFWWLLMGRQWKGWIALGIAGFLAVAAALLPLQVLGLVGGGGLLAAWLGRPWLGRVPVVSMVVVLWLPLFGEMLGSYPFLRLWEVKPEVPTGFVPSDGNGLNPLLQSFWMVIHPPVLFMGYALAILPFLEGVRLSYQAGVSPGDTRRLLRYTWLAVGGLGAGIALGALWAYETLNFGGYWNWDPVENASLAPWLMLVMGGHFVWLYRRGRTGLTLSLAPLLMAWPLVLYSAYLTRSGVLADSSVHSFTDLGLGGGLLYGVLISLAVAIDRLITQNREAYKWRWEALSVGGLLLGAIAMGILLLTSLPVLNLILGTRWALGSGALRVYYEWAALLTFPALFLMGYAYVQAWRAKGWRAVTWAAAVGLLGLIAGLWYKEWDFVFHEAYRQGLSADWLTRIRSSLYLVVDDLLLGGALIGLGAVAAVVLAKRRGSLAGSLAHAGFSLMVVGAVFSSGYERVLSVPISPSFGQSADNILLAKGMRAAALGYWIAYEGMTVPLPPLRDFQVVLSEEGQKLWRFRDSLGLSYQVWLPEVLFSEAKVLPTSSAIYERFIIENVALLPVQPADNAYRYRLKLISFSDTTVAYPLTLKADISEKTGLLAHPAHVRFWHGDLYVHLVSVPRLEGRGFGQFGMALAIGEEQVWSEEQVGLRFERLTEVEGTPHPTYRAWVRVWRGLPTLGQSVPVSFSIVGRELQTPSQSVPAQGLAIRVDRIDPAAKKIHFLIQIRQQPDAFVGVKVLYKPFIGLLWAGIALMLIGVAVGVWRHR